MHVNHAYVLDFIRTHSAPGAASLDYGCGGAEVVAAGRREGLDITGVDVFYEGGNSRRQVEAQGLLGTAVKTMDGDRIDFPDGHFDLLVNNQVLEHVEDLDAVLGEMKRVLKPGGRILCVFPSRDVWREGHCGIPLLHRFPKKSRVRVYYACLLRTLGLGYHKDGKSRMAWARDFCEWLDTYTHYRPRKEVVAACQDQGMSVTPAEYAYVLFRLKYNRSRLYPLFRSLSNTRPAVWLVQQAVRRLGGVVFVAERTPRTP